MRARTLLMWPVKVSFSRPDASSHSYTTTTTTTNNNHTKQQSTFYLVIFRHAHTQYVFNGLLTLIVLSPEPVANHSLLGSTVTQRTQPRWPLITLINFHGACHCGFMVVRALRCTICCVPRLNISAWTDMDRQIGRQ